MVRVKPGGIRAGLETRITDIFKPVTGVTATDGVVYSSVATVGTTAVEVFTTLIDPGITLGIQELSAGFTQKFTGLNGSVAGSLAYYWRVRTEAKVLGSGGAFTNLTGAYVNVTGTQAKLVGTLVAYEDTFSHNALSLGSIPYAPVRISLMAIGLAAANVKGEVKNSTYVGVKGLVIPGT